MRTLRESGQTFPASLILVHGAGSGPWVFQGWESSFPGLSVVAVDLHAGLLVSTASMRDYTDNIIAAAEGLPRPIALCGWSMGGLAALQAAGDLQPHSMVLIEPSPPGEVQGFDSEVRLTAGVFDPERVYGRFPPAMPPRPESERARLERKRGVSVPSLLCPSLVICGEEFRQERGTSVATFYGSELLYYPGLGHWDIVLDPQVRAAIARFIYKERAPTW